MSCPCCGADISATRDKPFCPSCGATLRELTFSARRVRRLNRDSNLPTVESGGLCQRCGTSLPAGHRSRFCRMCGFVVDEPELELTDNGKNREVASTYDNLSEADQAFDDLFDSLQKAQTGAAILSAFRSDPGTFTPVTNDPTASSTQRA